MEVECLGACDRAPAVMVNDAWHECLTPEKAATLVDDLRARGEDALSGCHHVIEKNKSLCHRRLSVKNFLRVTRICRKNAVCFMWPSHAAATNCISLIRKCA